MDNSKRLILQAQFDLRIRASTVSPHYSVVINSTVGVCSFLNGTDRKSPLMSFIYQLIERTFPQELLHPCPYIGAFEMKNVSILPNRNLAQFLGGYYKLNVRMFDEKERNICTITSRIELG